MFTDHEKLKAALAEVGMRRRVYARMVSEGRMTREAAERGVAIMVEIAKDYESRVAPELLLPKHV